jgi:acyl-coenzyme A thioesterase PaaI-like protein
VTGPPSRGYPAAATFATPARLRLAAAVRDLIDSVLTSLDAPEADLETAAATIEALVGGLRVAGGPGAGAADPPAGAPEASGPDARRRHGDFVPRSPLVGPANPISPPFDYDLRDGRLHAHGVFTAAFEGPPGYVHGGWVALAFDEALGLANVASGRGGLTGRLTVRYRRPTPLHRELRIEAHTARADGRRVTTRGHLFDGDTLLAEAEGLFVGLDAERTLEYFGERLAPPEPVDPLP